MVVEELLCFAGELLGDSRRRVEAGDVEDVDDEVDEVDAGMMVLVLAFFFGATTSVLLAAATALRGMILRSASSYSYVARSVVSLVGGVAGVVASIVKFNT